MTIRLARVDESKDLTELAFRSKAHWPYDKALLEAYRGELEVFKEDILAGSIYVCEVEHKLVGFCALSSDIQKQRLHFLFVDPNYIGKGYGKALWLEAISVAKSRGWNSISFYADKYAVDAFYKHQGCKVIGSMDSKLGQLTEMIFQIS